MKFRDIIDEQVFWDDGNINALKSYSDDEPKEKYKIIVKEPFEFETTKSEDYYVLKQLLYKADANFDFTTEKL